MKRILSALAVLTALTAPASAAHPVSCAIVADIAGNAVSMRQSGFTQQETAQTGALYFSRWVNAPETVKSFSNEQRHAMAHAWGNIATHIVQRVYSDPRSAEERAHTRTPEAAAQWAYDTCMRQAW